MNFFKKTPKATAKPAASMNAHSIDAQWRYIVPPEKTARIVIHQRQDGFYSTEAVGKRGHYYVLAEGMDCRTGLWAHMPGSLSGVYPTFEEAHRVATERWVRLRNEQVKGRS